jgi:hypothetical protein
MLQKTTKQDRETEMATKDRKAASTYGRDE